MVVLPSDSNIHYVGRIDKIQSNDYYAFSWSGCQIIFNVTGTTQVQAILNSEKVNWFDVFINGQLSSVFNVTESTPNQQQITIANNLNSEVIYQIKISKRTEAEFGQVNFYGFQMDDSFKLFSYTPLTNRKFEFIGDSIATGYGDMGKAPCAFTESTENVDVSFVTDITDQLFGEMSVIAWEGKGVVKNYGSSTPISNPNDPTLPDLYPFILPLSDNSSYWNPSEFIPDVLVINLGSNDYTDLPYPPNDYFQSKFIEFVKLIISNYNPIPKIFFICGVMVDEHPCCTVTEAVSNVFNATYIDMPNIQNSSDDFGCYGHPTIIAHAHMASIAIPIIKQVMNW
ncbi:hypothetical protein RB653_003445 [Dictyostelium firmibasis]|uniref:Carbohydrate esterase 2 N-terminal domain-containing protein n=1 Tax=Dictyostelium firmibasis TaxID=79012 RepID=A0AAN7U936_9MYCE